MPIQAEQSKVELDRLRSILRDNLYCEENACVELLLERANRDQAGRDAAMSLATRLVNACRQQKHERGTLDAFLQEFGLSNKEGIALMCLAESLLRIPDGDTASELIAEKVSSGDWAKHLGLSDSLFVNASTWSLMLTGNILDLDRETTENPGHWVKKLVGRASEPVVRNAMLAAMRIMGGQYVLGRDIDEARARGIKQNEPGTRFSFDMLGEGARTMADARRYLLAYENAIHSIGKGQASKGPEQLAVDLASRDSISIKLSALHPRYEFNQQARVMTELLPRVLSLAKLAKQYKLGLSIDAEESERLDLSLDIFAALAAEEALAGWDGLGFVLQAYQKRAATVADWLIALGRQSGRRFMVRLVKGAYWDREIKRAQELGLADYPVFTRKVSTDLSYQYCAEKLLAATDIIYPQFATHNAYTLARIISLAADGQCFEFQRLHGMGELLYKQLHLSHPDIPVRVYAPVGAHKDLLPYLVRRLLENGANSSFVNRFMDEQLPVNQLLEDVQLKLSASKPLRHPALPLPKDLFVGSEVPRANSKGFDLDDYLALSSLQSSLQSLPFNYSGGSSSLESQATEDLYSPGNQAQRVGEFVNATLNDVIAAAEAAHRAYPAWNRLGVDARAKIIENLGQILQAEQNKLIHLLAHEAGRTLDDGVSEVREAVDFCFYYSAMARRLFAEGQNLTGPTGETNVLHYHGRGVFACISPWNFPLAIFVGQIVAALVSGNSVLAKPAEQTPLISTFATDLMYKAGVPTDVLHLLTGNGPDTGQAVIAQPQIAGVVFTGSTIAAKTIQRQLAAKPGPIVPLIAETGGLNTMLVDSTALPEQVVDDVITSAFKSAGQRCSALRVLYLQNETADHLLEMLKGACEELSLGEPVDPATDIGPVIDASAREKLLTHIAAMDRQGKVLYRYPQHRLPDSGTFLGPHIVELESIHELKEEVFGPVLHVIRFAAKNLPAVIEDINQTGFGLTLGIHSRIERRARWIFEHTRVGNTYVNRNMIGAVVGVNPFGGEGLSGTGPKAGGPDYLLRFVSEKTWTVNTVATGGNAQLFQLVQ